MAVTRVILYETQTDYEHARTRDIAQADLVGYKVDGGSSIVVMKERSTSAGTRVSPRLWRAYHDKAIKWREAEEG